MQHLDILISIIPKSMLIHKHTSIELHHHDVMIINKTLEFKFVVNPVITFNSLGVADL